MGRFVRLGILITWLALMVVLIRGQGSETEPPAPMASVPAPPRAGHGWLNVFHQGQKIGYVHYRSAPIDGGHRFEQHALLRLVVMDAPQTVRTVVSGETGSDHSLKQFTFELSSGVGTLRVRGHADATELNLTMATAAEESTQSIPLTGPIYLPATLRSFLAAGQLEAGRRLQVQVFDPSVMKNAPVQITVERREPVPDGPADRLAWRVREEFQGIRTTAWVDDEGTVLREEGPMGMILVRTGEREAIHEGWSGDNALDLVRTVAVPVTRTIEQPRELKLLRLRLSGIDLDQIPSDTRQRRSGDTWTVTRENVAELASYPLPYASSEHRTELASTPLLQIEHPRVRAAAAEALGEERDATGAVRRLLAWISDFMVQEPTLSIPNALQVLDERRGDCNEHAVLFAALARAAGLPTRVVAGVVYLEGSFFYHAWNEVWLGEWVAVDPAFGQFPADSTHVKFVHGGPEEQFQILHVIGRIGIEVLATG